MLSRPARTERKLQRLREECSNWLKQVEKRDRHTWSQPACCTPRLHACVCECRPGVGAESWVSADRFGESTGGSCAESLKRPECGLGGNWGCVWDETGVCDRSPTADEHLKGEVGPRRLHSGQGSGSTRAPAVPPHRGGAEI